MDYDERVAHANDLISARWDAECRARKLEIVTWASTFRDGAVCKLRKSYVGGFNTSLLLDFEDGVQWIVRFAVPGKVMNVDEKLRGEVATMKLVRERTSIPVPKVHAWGLSRDNPLGLGAFIIMDFVVGEPLESFLAKMCDDSIPRLKSHITDQQLRTVYRQIAGFYLELAKLEFSQVGSLSIRSDQTVHADEGPLTLKMEVIEANGGVRVGGDRSATFNSTHEYFRHIAQQDIDHLHNQPNSIDNADDARAKYKARSQLKSIVSRFVNDEYDKTKFTLFCDDLRYGNMIVNNTTELKIVGVVDWEWSYSAPFQLFCSPPRWLTLYPPSLMPTFECALAVRYKQCLNLFLEELELEEAKREEVIPPVQPKKKLAEHMRESMTNGRFWFHELMYDSFYGTKDLAWRMVREQVPDIDELVPVSKAEMNAFAETKIAELEKYNADWAAIEATIKAAKSSVVEKDKAYEKTTGSNEVGLDHA